MQNRCVFPSIYSVWKKPTKFYNVLLLRCLLHIINVSHFVLHICRLMDLSVMSVRRTIVIKPGMTVDL